MATSDDVSGEFDTGTAPNSPVAAVEAPAPIKRRARKPKDDKPSDDDESPESVESAERPPEHYPEVVMTAQDMEREWAKQNANARAYKISLLSRDYPEVAEILNENEALKAEIAKLKEK